MVKRHARWSKRHNRWSKGMPDGPKAYQMVKKVYKIPKAYLRNLSNDIIIWLHFLFGFKSNMVT